MFAALYGKLIPHRWRGPERDGDAYSLFHQRSLAMGWLDGLGSGRASGRKPAARGLWSMNDAGWEHPRVPAEAQLAGWFQVEVEVVSPDRPLPVQPFLRCAGDVMDRIGVLHLSAVQLLLPVGGIDASARPPEARIPSLLTIHWFRESDARSRVGVEVHVNLGQDPSIAAVTRSYTEGLDRLPRDVFACKSVITGTPHGIPTPPLDESAWGGPPLFGLTLQGELSEWTVDAIGWLSEVLADIAADAGIRRSLLLTVRRQHSAFR
jgi:hypothetical protein